MSVVKKIAGQTAIYGIPGILARTLNFLLAYIHLDVFRPSNYGIITELYAYVGFIMVLLMYGMETAFFRFVQKEPEAKIFNTLQGGLYLSSLLFLAPVAYFSDGIASSLGYSNSGIFVLLLAGILCLDVLAAIPLARLRHREKPLNFVAVNMAGILTNIGLNLYFFWYCYAQVSQGRTPFFFGFEFRPEDGVYYVFLANLLGSAVKYLMCLPAAFPKVQHMEFKLWKKAFTYAWPLVLTGLAGLINEVADRALIKNILSPQIGVEAALYQLGIYGACYKLSLLINICVQAFRYAAEPLFFKQLKERKDEHMIKVLNYLVGFVLLVFITVSLYLDIFKHFIRTEEYWQGLNVVPLLLLANCFLAIHIHISMWYKLADKTKYGIIIAGIAAIVTLTGNFALVPVYGYMGAAITTLAVYALLPTLSYLLSRKVYFIPYEIKKLALLGGYACLLVVIGFYWLPNLHFSVKALLLLSYIAVFCLVEKVPVKKLWK